MGKTTYCQKLAYDWATKQDEWDPSFPKIEVLLLLKCHEMKCDIWETIDDQILPKEMDDEAKECFFKFIRENQSKVLLVLDGLDEADPDNLKMFYNLVESKELSGFYIVVTCRHETRRNARRYCDTLWEIVGFTRKDAKSFIHKYFENVSKEFLAPELIQMIWSRPSSIKSDLGKLTKNPLNTVLLCVIFEDFEGTFPTSRTQLYIEIVLCILRRYEQKQGLSSENEKLLTVYKEELLYLGRMATQSLLKEESYFEHKSGGRFIFFSKFGFLSPQASGSKRKDLERYAFLHKSFQEFFSGFYLACKLIEEDIDFKSVLADHRYWNELYQVFLFAIGIVATTSEKTAEVLVNTMAANVKKHNSKRLVHALCSLSEYPNLLHTFGEQLKFTRLNLSDKRVNLFHYNAVAPLSEALATKSSVITNLNLSRNDIGDSGAKSISRALVVNSSLTNLDLSRNSISDSGAESISQALAANTSLTNLDLSWNDIGDSGAESISRALVVNSSLTNLDLSRNSISDSGAESISQALAANTSLTNLDLSWNFIFGSGAASLFKALAVNSSLNNLDLSRNCIEGSGAASLCQALAVTSSLNNLCLSWNGLCDSGAATLSLALSVNTSLTNLNLSWNGIGNFGASSLFRALAANSSLAYLDLSRNFIGDSGVASLSKAVKTNSCITTIDLSWNRIGNSGAASLSRALAANSSLTYLDLRWNRIGDSGATALSKVHKVNKTVKVQLHDD